MFGTTLAMHTLSFSEARANLKATMDEPAHIHVIGDGEMKVTIREADGLPEMVSLIGLKAGDRRRAMDVILEHQDEFLARWDDVHGGRR